MFYLDAFCDVMVSIFSFAKKKTLSSEFLVLDEIVVCNFRALF